MAKVEVIMPAMGEGIIEATVTRLLAQVGVTIDADDPIIEVATDKVDSEVCALEAGTIVEILCAEGDIVSVGSTLAILETTKQTQTSFGSVASDIQHLESGILAQTQELQVAAPNSFLSPLVRSIIGVEKISELELTKIKGTGAGGRITKRDLLAFLENRHITMLEPATERPKDLRPETPRELPLYEGDQYIEMDRMRRLIADHMVDSKRVSPHVTSFVEVDMTPIVHWREKNKAKFEASYGTKLTYTPFFIAAAAKALRDFPLVNVSVSSYRIIKRAAINIGIATALPDGNLIVPVIKNADKLNLAGVADSLNRVVVAAREKNLKPDQISGGTFSITNVGSFGNLTGTPIINQPQAAILAVGTIEKRPAVIETPMGDTIGIKQLMIMSLSFDHRAIDGYLGGTFLKRVATYLEQFDFDKI